MVVVDTTRCVGCRICEMTCSFSKHRVFAPSLSHIRIGFGDDGLVVPVVASGCDTCLACVRNCPVHAIRPVKLRPVKQPVEDANPPA